MKSKYFSRTLQSKSGLIFFAILVVYNLLLFAYLKDFLVLSPMLLTFYLLSVLPPLLFVIRIRSVPVRSIAYVVLFVVLLISQAQPRAKRFMAFANWIALSHPTRTFL